MSSTSLYLVILVVALVSLRKTSYSSYHLSEYSHSQVYQILIMSASTSSSSTSKDSATQPTPSTSTSTRIQADRDSVGDIIDMQVDVAGGPQVEVRQVLQDDSGDGPWLGLGAFVQYSGTTPQGNLRYKCVACMPEEKYISVSMSTRFNIRRHFKK